jgi:ABC-type Fe3+/spermidine/putrescine transport system ATPase subunit
MRDVSTDKARMADRTGPGAVAPGAVPRVAAVSLSHITHRFGAFVALDDVSLDVWPGEFVTLLGQSGSGKSTLLRIIAGLTAPSAGRVLINGRDVSTVPTQRRGVGFVFQNYALFPHLTVFENIAYPLRIRSMKMPEIQQRVEQALARVNLHGLGDRFAAQLSGGQQQRVAVARALVYEPAVLLMDEPLGALDRKLRKHMQIELRQLQQDLRISCVYVTHDQEEALTMSDRIAVMQGGRIYQVGDPVTVYRHPVSSFVADFVGSTNLFECRVLGVGVDCDRRGHADPCRRLSEGGRGPGLPCHGSPGIRPDRRWCAGGNQFSRTGRQGHLRRQFD